MKNNETETSEKMFPWKLFVKFLVPSLFGFIIFLMPIMKDGQLTIMLGIFVDTLSSQFPELMLQVVVWICVLSAFLGFYHIIFKPDWKEGKPILHAMAHTTPIWLFLRTAGAIIGLAVLYEFGPEVLRMEDTGHVMYKDVGIGFVLLVIPGCFLMPFLTEFGAMDFIGVMVAPLFRKAFKLPGRSAVDAISSFVSSSLVGIMLTSQQYKRNRYTGREAVAIVTNFSVVSLPFAIVIASVANIGEMFFVWYFASTFVCILCAMITVRIPPLSNIPDVYRDGSVRNENDEGEYSNIFAKALKTAMATADKAPPVGTMASLAARMAVEQLSAVLGPSLALGTISTVLAYHSPVGEMIGAPVAWILSLFDVAEASKLAPGFLFGFLDQFVPAVIAGTASDKVMSFVLAGLSLCQVIFMSETGVIILRSGLPVKFIHLLQIFLIRTVIIVPVLWVIGSLVL